MTMKLEPRLKLILFYAGMAIISIFSRHAGSVFLYHAKLGSEHASRLARLRALFTGLGVPPREPPDDPPAPGSIEA